ncbi:LPS export ABC transporter periplasmic protein LptC [Agrilutibacter solisilvae]|uniref:LPS export ABC transporter periplasmic protein LptC n=1 Tax=Agrilutibacter solisilvae TaxID=2763317 RepID=A0A975ARZ7_9GAMM|nr:LPS export ABC transporter periplasmic protein LptC [Lysobacter solisilvae]QSX78394.1 LPS export ABC transporter periplasmic protein LptC [Lysobacter solisilvae]
MIATLALVAGAILTGWSVFKQDRQDAGPTGPIGRSDYVLEEFELVSLDREGRESFTLRGPRLARDPGAKVIDIATPLFVIPPGKDAGADAWEVRAQSGWVSADGDELRLRGHVRGTSMGAGLPTTMTTEELNVFPETRSANSPGTVVITRPGSILSGRGLQLNLATKRYSFKSEVHHRYDPTSR